MLRSPPLMAYARWRSQWALARHCRCRRDCASVQIHVLMVAERRRVERRAQRVDRGTHRLASDRKLSRLLVDYYRDEAAQRGLTERYEERVRLVQPQLEHLSRQGVESAFVLHALVCTWLGRLVPNWQTWPTRALDAPGTRRAMLRAVRALKNVGRATIVGLFGDPEEAQGARFYIDLGILEQLLSGGTYPNPAFQIVGPRSPRPRQRDVYRMACLISL